MDKKDTTSWLSILIPIVLLAVAVHLLFDYNPKTERLMKLMSEINSSKTH